MIGDISPLFSLPQYDASNLLGYPRSTFCRKWKQATACSASAAMSAPAEFFEGQSTKKKSKRQSLGKPQTVYRRWPYRRLKMIEERVNAILDSEGESFEGLIELLTERILLSEPVFFEINPAHSHYCPPQPVFPKQVLDHCKEDGPLDINSVILGLVNRLPTEILSIYPVPFPDSQEDRRSTATMSRVGLFEPGVASSPLSYKNLPESFLESFLSSITTPN